MTTTARGSNLGFGAACAEGSRAARFSLVVTIDIRRHAERASGPDARGSLSAAGARMALRLRPRRPYALVVSSPRDRARETATIIADRVDEVDMMLDVAPDEALTQAQYDSLRSQQAVAKLIQASAWVRRFADEQLSLWDRVASRVPEGESALLVTHGGNIQLPAVLLATRIGGEIGALPLTYCEGVRVRYDHGRPEALERLRAE